MARNLEIGKQGEELAVQYLLGRNWTILERNWRSGHREVDIIAETGDEVIIVEVKARKRLGAERLEEHITRQKQKSLIRSAEAYLKLKQLDKEVRFDVILLTGEPGDFRLEHIEDAFSAWEL